MRTLILGTGGGKLVAVPDPTCFSDCDLSPAPGLR